jgi:hypothetical protein
MVKKIAVEDEPKGRDDEAATGRNICPLIGSVRIITLMRLLAGKR